MQRTQGARSRGRLEDLYLAVGTHAGVLKSFARVVVNLSNAEVTTVEQG